MKNVYLKLILLVIVISLVHQLAPVPLKYPKTNNQKISLTSTMEK